MVCSKPRYLVRDLHRLLQLVAQPGPYILVGHSIGGLIIRLYAYHYPQQIVGMALIDPTHYDSFARERAVLPPESPSDSVTLQEMLEQLNQRPIPSRDDLIDTLELVAYFLRCYDHLRDPLAERLLQLPHLCTEPGMPAPVALTPMVGCSGGTFRMGTPENTLDHL